MSQLNATLATSYQLNMMQYWTTDILIETVLKSAFFAVGLPINLILFWRLTRYRWITSARVTLLVYHLNVSDILLQLVNFPIFLWKQLGSYYYLSDFGGFNVLCKLGNFLTIFTIQASSNIVTCIAIDRLMFLVMPRQSLSNVRKFARAMLWISWIFAGLSAFPQLFVWKSYEYPNRWRCTTTFKHYCSKARDFNESKLCNDNFQHAYHLFHLTVVSWLPQSCIFICYSVILYQIVKNVYMRQKMAVEMSTRSQSVLKYMKDSTTVYELCDCSRNPSRTRVAVLKHTNTSTFVTMAAVVVTYIVGMLPYNILSIWFLISPETYVQVVQNYPVRWLYALHFCTGVINPFIYASYAAYLRRPAQHRASIKAQIAREAND